MEGPQEMEHHQFKPTDVRSTLLSSQEAGGTECINVCKGGPQKGLELKNPNNRNWVSGKEVNNCGQVHRGIRRFQKR